MKIYQWDWPRHIVTSLERQGPLIECRRYGRISSYKRGSAIGAGKEIGLPVSWSVNTGRIPDFGISQSHRPDGHLDQNAQLSGYARIYLAFPGRVDSIGIYTQILLEF